MKKVIASAVLAAVLAVPASASTLLFNGSFEDGSSVSGHTGQDFDDLAGNTGAASWEVFSSLEGWTATSGRGIEIQTNGTLNSIDAYDGEHYVELDSLSNSSMEQTVFLREGTYQLSFFYAPRTNRSTSNRISFGIVDSLLGNNVFADSVNARTSTQPGWQEVTQEFLITSAGDYSLFFAATGRNDSLGGLIDNVSLAPVPLPASGLLLLAGLGGVAAMRRRKKA